MVIAPVPRRGLAASDRAGANNGSLPHAPGLAQHPPPPTKFFFFFSSVFLSLFPAHLRLLARFHHISSTWTISQKYAGHVVSVCPIETVSLRCRWPYFLLFPLPPGLTFLTSFFLLMLLLLLLLLLLILSSNQHRESTPTETCGAPVWGGRRGQLPCLPLQCPESASTRARGCIITLLHVIHRSSSLALGTRLRRQRSISRTRARSPGHLPPAPGPRPPATPNPCPKTIRTTIGSPSQRRRFGEVLGTTARLPLTYEKGLVRGACGSIKLCSTGELEGGGGEFRHDTSRTKANVARFV